MLPHLSSCYCLALLPVPSARTERFRRRKQKTKHPLHRRRRHGLRRRRLSRLKRHPDAEPRRARQGRRPFHERLRLRAVLFAHPRRPADWPLSGSGSATSSTRARHRRACRVSETTIADRLKAAGYATGLVGKWHLGAQPKFHPQKRGFDEFFGFLGGAHSYFNDTTACSAARSQVRGEGISHRRLRPRGRGSSSRGTRTSRSFSISRSTPCTRRCSADDPRLKKFATSPDQAAADLRRDDVGDGRGDRPRSQEARRNWPEAEHAGHLHQRQRRPDDAGHDDQRLEQQAAARLQAHDARRRHSRAVPRLLDGPREAGASMTSRSFSSISTPRRLTAAGVNVKPEWKLDGVELLPFFSGEKKRRAARDASTGGSASRWRSARATTSWSATTPMPTRSPGKKNQPTAGPKLYNLKDDIGEKKDVLALDACGRLRNGKASGMLGMLRSVSPRGMARATPMAIPERKSNARFHAEHFAPFPAWDISSLMPRGKQVHNVPADVRRL